MAKIRIFTKKPKLLSLTEQRELEKKEIKRKEEERKIYNKVKENRLKELEEKKKLLEKSDEYVIFPDSERINFNKYDISRHDELCFLKIENMEKRVKKYIGIVYSITLGLDHSVNISTDSNGTDWTGYLGG